jgi:hypothetical protein
MRMVAYEPSGQTLQDEEDARDKDSPESIEPLGQAVHTVLLGPEENEFEGQGAHKPPEEKVPGPQARQDEAPLCNAGSTLATVP